MLASGQHSDGSTLMRLSLIILTVTLAIAGGDAPAATGAEDEDAGGGAAVLLTSAEHEAVADTVVDPGYDGLWVVCESS